MAEGERMHENVGRGGYNKRCFVKREKALEYRCGTCQEVLKDPQQIVICGHQFCQCCLPAEVTNCPACNRDVRANQVFPDASTKRKVLALQVRCPARNVANHCNWKGTLQEFEEKHKFECALNLVECSNEACNEMVPREELRKHLEEECQHRQIRCRHCGINITVANERRHNEEECQRIPVACPNLCTEEIPREEVQHHVENECEKTVVDCTFQSVGCGAKIERGKLREHEEHTVHEHLSQAAIVINNLARQNQELSQQQEDMNNILMHNLQELNEREGTDVNRINAELNEFKQIGTMRLDSVQKASEQNFESLNQVVGQNGLFQETLQLNEAELSRMNADIYKVRQTCMFINQSMIKKLGESQEKVQRLITVVHNKLTHEMKKQQDEINCKIDALREALEEERVERHSQEAKTAQEISKLARDIEENSIKLEKQNVILVTTRDEMQDKFHEHCKQMQLDYDYLSQLITNEKECRENDFVQLKEEICDPQSKNGEYIWRVDNVKDALRKAKATRTNPVYGKAFSSEPFGYVLQPKIFFNGARQRDEGYISIFIQILKGKYDPILAWPFHKQIRITLIERDKRGHNLQKEITPTGGADELRRPSEEANNGFGIYKYVSHEVLQAGGYIMDDAMFVKIQVLGTEPNAHSETI